MHPGCGINEQGSGAPHPHKGRACYVGCLVTPSILLFLTPPPYQQPPATLSGLKWDTVMVGLRSNSAPHRTQPGWLLSQWPHAPWQHFLASQYTCPPHDHYIDQQATSATRMSSPGPQGYLMPGRGLGLDRS